MRVKGLRYQAPLFAGFCQVEAALLDQVDNRCGNPPFIGNSEPYDIRKRSCVTGFFSRFFQGGHFTL
jgi:hypothetical protein